MFSPRFFRCVGTPFNCAEVMFWRAAHTPRWF